MRVKYVYLDEQFAQLDEYFEDLREWAKTGEFTIGPFVEKFERKFADYIGVKHAIGTNTGTGALILALKAAGVRPGDEVITVPNTFIATVGAIVAAGARPVFVDCDERYNIDASKIEEAITPLTKAILPVHWAGCPADIEEIVAIGDKHGIPIVEDACPAVGASVNGKRCGSFGKASGFSMHPLKPLNVMGDGGIVVTNDDEAADFLRLYRNHGLRDRDHVEIWGVNERLQPFQAVIATRLLDTVDHSNALRNRNARLLDEGLKGLEEFIRPPARPEGYYEVYQLYIASATRRDELLKYLVAQEIECKIHYPIPLHLQQSAQGLGYKEGDFPVAERQAQEIITIPAHQHVTPEQIEFVVDCIRKFYKG
ncbi:MAG: DegT/DnrJ/EryC1/StrS family aminotransferase [Leptolyngbyaceae cyanobacterium bins.59]|nr:DegT/DnrJ/EryC1/StrS family aminotransferase [Leptolyngbyaceae cyanobacterium bins.59]